MSYVFSQEDYALACQPICRVYVKIEIYNKNGTLVNILNGLVNGGTESINSDSSVRRTFQPTIVPTDEQSINIAEDSALWIDKRLKLFVGIKDVSKESVKWYPQGVYVMTNSNVSYNATSNQLQLDCSDRMTELDGTVNGELGGALDIVIPAYDVIFKNSWIALYGSFDAAYDAVHKNSPLLLHSDVRELVKQLFTTTMDDGAKRTQISNIQAACDKYGIVYKVDFGTSSDDVILLGYNIIKSVVKTFLTKYADTTDFLVEDIGEYKGMNSDSYRAENPLWDCVPYDQEFSSGDTLSSVLEKLCTLYSGYDYAYDEDGVFNVKMIPTLYEDDVILTHKQLLPLLVADDTENTSTDLTSIRNICEIWGQAFDTDYYVDTSTISGATYNLTITGYSTEYVNGDVISAKLCQTCGNNPSINVNNLGAIPIYDDYTDKPITAGKLLANNVYTFKYRKQYINGQYVHKFYLLGQYQVHGLCVLSDGTTIKNGYTTTVDGATVTVDKYSEDYFRYKYNCQNVKIDIIENSPYVVQKIGERNKVYSGSDYENLTSDSSAIEMASYQLWKNCRLTDCVTIKTTLLPWITEYQKISYMKANTDTVKQYITHNITHDFENYTTTIEMYTFYPLYKE